jgi:c-di-GMP-binding flagellar brake protein YcgR
MAEKRKFNRWQVNRPAKIKLAGAETFTSCNIHDISMKGLKVSLPLKLPPDTFLELKIALSDELTLQAQVWIVWHKTVDNFNVYGLYFSKIPDSDKEKIYRFIRRDFPEQMNKQWWPDIYQKKGGEPMKKAKFEDRRVFERLPASLSLRFLDLISNKEGTAQTQDISAKGIGLRTNVELQPRTPLEIWLEIPDKGEPLYTRGEVVWSRPQEANTYRVGINLEEANLMGLARLLRIA